MTDARTPVPGAALRARYCSTSGGSDPTDARPSSEVRDGSLDDDRAARRTDSDWSWTETCGSVQAEDQSTGSTTCGSERGRTEMEQTQRR